MRLVSGSASDVGQLRSLNEDSFVVAESFVAVADGMGGHRGGEVASARALAAFEAAIDEPTLDAVMAAVQAANRDVFEYAKVSPDLSGMGTTLCSVAALDDRSVAVVNVGDSRVYLLRDGQLVQVSQDHSFVETLVRDGRLTREQADVHPQRNVLSRAIGIESMIDVDGWQVPVQNNDRFLLCSDGLFNEVDDSRLQEVLAEVTDPTDAARQLAAEANEHGGRDNITCVIADIVDMDESIKADLDLGRPLDESLTRRSSAADLDETIAAHSNPVNVVGASADPDTPVAPLLKVRGKNPRRFGWRTAVFVFAILGCFASAIAATDWYYKNTYSVGAVDGQVVIFRGPPDTNILWFRPEVLSTDVSLAELREAERAKVVDGVAGLSQNEATNYVGTLVPPSTTTTLPPETTTTIAPETVPSEVTPATPAPAVPVPDPAAPAPTPQ